MWPLILKLLDSWLTWTCWKSGFSYYGSGKSGKRKSIVLSPERGPPMSVGNCWYSNKLCIKHFQNVISHIVISFCTKGWKSLRYYITIMHFLTVIHFLPLTFCVKKPSALLQTKSHKATNSVSNAMYSKKAQDDDNVEKEEAILWKCAQH